MLFLAHYGAREGARSWALMPETRIDVPLTAVDLAISRELFARALTRLAFPDGVPHSEIRELSVPPLSRTTFLGHPFQGGVGGEAALDQRLRAAETATPIIRHYQEMAFRAAIAANYVPFRTGGLDPLLRDPTDGNTIITLAGTGPLLPSGARGQPGEGTCRHVVKKKLRPPTTHA